MGKHIIIVGGVAGGATTATRLRRLDETAVIILFERGEYISFANCGLPYHIGGVIPKRDNLLVQTEARMKERFRIDVRTRAEVIHIDREQKIVEVRDHRTGSVYKESYDVLVLSPGAAPMRPNLPGIDNPFLFSLRNIADMDRIITSVDAAQKGKAAVVGGGFIGVEMAENLTQRGFEVALIEMTTQVMPNLDPEMAAIVHGHLRDKGVDLMLGSAVSEFKEAENGVVLLLQDGRQFKADLGILAIGVRPENTLAREAGLAIGSSGGVIVGRDLRTSDPDIFAVGDAAEAPGPGSDNTMRWVPLAGPANRQGRLVADIICGRKESYYGALGTSVAKIFNLTAASTGMNEKTLKKDCRAYKTCIVHPSDHAAYYPGARPLSLKLLFTPEGDVLGAQAIGYEGVEKRIDVIASAIYFKATVTDLAALELSYAPPFSSAKDPVNIAGYVAGNIIQGGMDVISWDDMKQLKAGHDIILDVRENAERLTGLIEDSVNIPLDQLRERLHELPQDKNIIVHCAVGLRAYLACRILMQNGFQQVRNLSGGYRTYRQIYEDLAMQKQGRNEPMKESTEKAKPSFPITASAKEQSRQERFTLDVCGLQCPGPIIQLYQKMQTLDEGQEVKVIATDPAFVSDIKAWAGRTGNTVLSVETNKDQVIAVVRKGPAADSGSTGNAGRQDKTIIVFSGDLDKTIASFIIANGAAAMGRKVTMFFTFWGLNVLRRPERINLKKPLLDAMFGWMMPRGSKKLGLSKMHMAGIGPQLIRYVMGQKNISSLEDLMKQAGEMGIRLVACQMSMDVMGIRKEELIDGIELGGVASYLAAAEEGTMNLFI